MDTETTTKLIKRGEQSESYNTTKPLTKRNRTNCCMEYRYMFAYSSLLTTLGALETFNSALFVEFEYQLNVDKIVIALIFTVKSISFGVSAIICAYIIDSFDQTHRYVSFIILLSAISITLIPFIQIVSVMYIIFIFIGIALGTIFVTFPVYIFREYPAKQTRMMYIVMTTYGICKTVIPLLIQLSISLTSTYQYALYLITIISISTCISLLILPTPKHDNYRTLKKDISSSKLESMNQDDIDYEDEEEIEESAKEASLALKSDTKHVYSQKSIIIILALIMTCFSATQSGLVNFITSYCDDYLDIGESIGRYMISGYYGGQLAYRLMVAICVGNNLKKIWLPSRIITIGFLMMNIFLILFMVLNRNIGLIFVVYIACGFFASGIFPDIFKWCEQMTPVSGILSCIFIAGFSGGDAFIVFIIGESIHQWSVKILPYPLLIASIIGTGFIFCNILLYRRYDRHKGKILSELQMDVRR